MTMELSHPGLGLPVAARSGAAAAGADPRPAAPQAATAAAAAGEPRLSVVIATCRRPELLQRCLVALLHQTLPREAYEIVVVDDGATEDTRALVEDLALRTRGLPRIHYLATAGRRGPATARNLGWRAARGAIVAFTDDDTVPDVEWLAAGEAAMAGARAAVAGRVFVPPPEAWTDHARMTQGLESAEFVTANCFVRKDALQQVGGFDERFTRAWREDSDLHYRLIRFYGAIPKAERALVLHPVRPAPWGVSLRQQANTQFDALLYRKHPELYRRKVGRVHAPPLYYGVVGGTLAALIAALAGSLGWALLALLAAAACVGLLTRRRLAATTRDPDHVAEMLLTSAAIPFLSLGWRWAGAVRWRVMFL